MAVIGWSMESGRRGKRASSGWEMFKDFGMTESLEAALWLDA
ncbi:hypothetical protein TNCV_4410241, partial [Trichonephila clavipes]